MIHAVALLANIGHGKTTAANFLRDRYGAKIVSLATPLKRAAKVVMKFSDEQLYGTQVQKERLDPRYGFSARHFLQSMGTEGLRQCFWPDVHIDALMRTLEREENQEYDELHVVDDCRFLNEAAAFGEVNAGVEKPHRTAVIKIVCTDAPARYTKHTSETEIDRVPPEHIAAIVSHSKAEGLDKFYADIIDAFDRAPKLAPFRRLLKEGLERTNI